MSQVSRVSLKSDRDAKFLDNTTGLITPVNLRAFLDNFIDSSPNVADDYGGNPAYLRNVSTTIPTASILTGNSVPVSVLAAQGAGTVIKIISVVYKFIGTVAFATNTNCHLRNIGASGQLTQNSTIIGSSANTYDFVNIVSNLAQPATAVENKGIEFFVSTGDPTAGAGSSLIVNIQYTILSI